MATTTQYKRASEFSKGIGDSLERIAGNDMLLVDYTVGERSMRGESRTFCEIMLATPSDPANVHLFHAWSDSLGEKLSDVPKDALPVLIKFVRVATAGGFRVWTFE